MDTQHESPLSIQTYEHVSRHLDWTTEEKIRSSPQLPSEWAEKGKEHLALAHKLYWKEYALVGPEQKSVLHHSV